MNFPITPDTTVAHLVDHWLHELRVGGRLEATTINPKLRPVLIRDLVDDLRKRGRLRLGVSSLIVGI
jgi:hypothetical protein